MDKRELLQRVVQCIAATTRYPVQVLTIDADLANDLGIDSVKRVEIIAALEREFQLELSSGQQRDHSIATIGQIAEWMERMMPTRNGHPSNGATPNSNGKSHASDSLVALDSRIPTTQTEATVTNSGFGSHPSDLAREPSDTFHRFSPPHSETFSPPHDAPVTHAPTMPRQIERVATTEPISPLADLTTSQHSKSLDTRPNGTARATKFAERHSPLAGRVALVTGSGRGVGRTIARLLALRGATVIVNSFHSRQQGEQVTAEIQAQGGKAVHLWGSVANPSQVDCMFDEIERQFGCLDILVCNASDGRIGSFTDIAPDDWERAFRTNVSGHYQCAMRASRLMQRSGGGAIVTMSSLAAQRYVEGLGGQGVIKAAVESLTRYLACELATYGIRTNCVSGGPVYGDVMSRYPAARVTLNYWETLVTDSELCSPMDLANAVAFLVSDESRGVNGAIWSVDHGLSTRSHSRPLPRPTLDRHPIETSGN